MASTPRRGSEMPLELLGCMGSRVVRLAWTPLAREDEHNGFGLGALFALELDEALGELLELEAAHECVGLVAQLVDVHGELGERGLGHVRDHAVAVP